ncbi:tyrosine-type recombinase/integrase [Citrobacter freundii]|uniref:Site-specific tyrosine recombinase XerC n=1 Tax=Citrobacter werkmanii TaxID=67827 RepID=A0A9N8CRX5_9ENTR|nr:MULTISPECIES: tyrosine-type recombinase/integrase [Citrobacter]MDH0784735.1 tyrosine-type recombinase/integrase [Citrobacter freundii]MDM3100054.1 tyrosine-type recombinase/integrase [Citrobacter sp. Cf140]MEB1122461.1 tyrosine-type recombinase/integrase [Citrobacter freundii]CAB5540818.1 site-specific tyrosine recombinase XerC [Citrobacter werkmanii]CAB5546030.1 site-specific tyrosine recombinase XerC [Citrobacter werkmanii]
MGAPRKHNIDIENLYVKLDKRNNKVYWQYKDPLTQKWQSFGTDEAAAKAAAIELNRLFAAQQVEQSYILIDIAKRRQQPQQTEELRFKDWVNKYISMLEKRQAKGAISASTLYERRHAANVLCDRIANTPLAAVGSREMAAILEEYVDEGKNTMAKHVRSNWIDLFKEAQFAGEVPPGFNPALSTRKPKVEVTRARLQHDDWQKIVEVARERYSPWAVNALQLALVTGQRLSDILSMKFRDVRDGYLWVVQGKTGNKIALPLTLHCNAVGLSLEDVINQCRDRALSPYLVHHSRTTATIKSGAAINKATASTMFARCRDAAGIIPPEGKTPVSFHEQRSLAERLYSAQGINTQELLGHKSAKMTEKYHDERNDGWVILAI